MRLVDNCSRLPATFPPYSSFPLALALVFRTVTSDGEAAAAIIGSRLCRVVVRGLLAVKVLSISSLAIDIRRGYQREAKDGDDTLIKG